MNVLTREKRDVGTVPLWPPPLPQEHQDSGLPSARAEGQTEDGLQLALEVMSSWNFPSKIIVINCCIQLLSPRNSVVRKTINLRMALGDQKSFFSPVILGLSLTSLS